LAKLSNTWVRPVARAHQRANPFWRLSRWSFDKPAHPPGADRQGEQSHRERPD